MQCARPVPVSMSAGPVIKPVSIICTWLQSQTDWPSLPVEVKHVWVCSQLTYYNGTSIAQSLQETLPQWPAPLYNSSRLCIHLCFLVQHPCPSSSCSLRCSKLKRCHFVRTGSTWFRPTARVNHYVQISSLSSCLLFQACSRVRTLNDLASFQKFLVEFKLYLFEAWARSRQKITVQSSMCEKEQLVWVQALSLGFTVLWSLLNGGMLQSCLC